MRFARPDLLYLLWIIPALILFYFWAGRGRRRVMEYFARNDLLPELTGRVHPGRRRLKTILLAAAVSLLLVTLLRPQWNFQWEEVKRKGLDILIAVDTSRSMLAEDVKPNRLERSKLALRDLVGKLEGDRIGLIAFAGSAFIQCPLTIDYHGFLLALDDLGAESIPRGGTSIAAAIREALRGYEGGQKKYQVLILITDGEDHEGDPLKAAEEAREAGIKIFCVGIGTGEGELIPVIDESGGREFVKDREGNVVKTRLDESVLEKIALATGGTYVRARGTEFGLEMIYREKLAKMEKRELTSKMRKRYREQFQYPLALAILLLLLEPLITERRN